MKIASLDLGTNTFLLLIAEVNEQGQLIAVEDHVEVTRLGQAVDKTGEFHKEALFRAEECFKNFKAIIERHNVDKVVASATSAARDAKNKADFFDLGKKYGIDIQVISGDREAELTYLGSTFDLENTSIAVIDVGGGSTEIIGQSNGKVIGKSLDVGSVRLTEKFVNNHPIQPAELSAMADFVKLQLQSNKQKLPLNGIKEVIAVAGTPTMLACLMQAIEFSEAKVHLYRISIQQLKDWQLKLAEMTIEERQKLKGMQPKRADVIVAGLTILYETLLFLGLKKITVSTKGVRYGLALDAAHTHS